ncbi:MAG: hypothetical protein M3133_05410 [Actinomycetota bacterium]|nr:hypothetical protein [Actinomycetota bacterium]
MREPSPGGTQVGGPGLGETVEQEPSGTSRVSPEQPWGQPSPGLGGMEQTSPTMGGMEQPSPTRGGLGQQAPGGESRESEKGGMLDSMKDALRKVKDAVTPDDQARDEEVRPGPLPPEPQEGRGHLPEEPQEGRGHLPEEPQEGRGGGLR